MGTWKFDPYHLQVEFSAKHLGMMTVRGLFLEVTATGDIHPDQPERTKVEATINTASIRTHNEQRDKDLRSSNFLEIDRYPTMTFKSTKIEPAGPDRYRLTGDLTIKGQSQPVELDGTIAEPIADPYGTQRLGLKLQGTVDRTKFGIDWNNPLPSGEPALGNDVALSAELFLVKA